MSNRIDRTARDNFLASLAGMSAQDAYANLRADTDSYGWNGATRTAISAGIREHFAKPATPIAQGGAGGWDTSHLFQRDELERERMAAEQARLPLGCKVRVRGAAGLGVGLVREHITEIRNVNGSSIPLRGHVLMLVRFPDGLEKGVDLDDTFGSHELSAVSQ